MKHHTPTVLMINGRNLYASDNCHDTIFIVNILQAYNQLSPLSHNTSEFFSLTTHPYITALQFVQYNFFI